MIHRIALLLGGLAALGVLAFAVIRGDPSASGAPPTDPLAMSPTDDVTATAPREVVDTVYVEAAPAPKVIRVTRRAKAPRAADPAPTRGARRHHDDEDERREGEGREHEHREHDDRDRDHEGREDD
jgi:hypothetical protein